MAMTHSQKRYTAITLIWAAVAYPLLTVIFARTWALDETLLYNLFPIFGVMAFTILWLHVISGVFERDLRKLINFDLYVRRTAWIVFVSIIMHPLLALFSFDFDLWGIIDVYGTWPIRLAVTGWLLLITYDIARLLHKKEFFRRHWRKILFISTIGIILAFFHSIWIGSDLQSGPLRFLWIFYGVTAILATIYNFGPFKTHTKKD